MRFVIVTGMSGAGKASTMKVLEDIGYFCVDNLPIALFSKFAEMLNEAETEMDKVALGLDIRSGQSLEKMDKELDQLKKSGVEFEILFLEAQDDILIKRYKETRHQHPLGGIGHVAAGIVKEREKIRFLKKRATYILDTSKLLIKELKAELEKIFAEGKEFKNLYVTVMSFGFKYGIPQDADIIFDVRFLPNPYYQEELRKLTGNDKAVQDFVLDNEKGQEFLKKLTDMAEFLLPNYVQEGKNQLIIALGCTGGQHRSVTLANALYQFISKADQYGTRIEHRDIQKDAVTKAR
ncbi:MAG: RNase adapter RapZ [Schaedlerella sp.]|nr:RNase adapter RapZ [Schaedlerella sp.]